MITMELVWLGQPACHDIALVGGKVANLSHLAADLPIPPGFCLTTGAFVQNQRATTVPPTIYEMIGSAYDILAEHCQLAEPSVAVRSSAVDEDGQTSSYAGQYETYLNIIGVEAIAEAVARCWMSAHSERVLAYRRQRGQPTNNIALAVLVQQLVAADISVVAFSANPVTGDREQIVINANWGLGESVVSGTVTPDTHIVRKLDLTVIERNIADKQRMTVIVPNGVQEVTVPRPMRRQRVMSDAQAVEVAQLARALETQMGWPVDIECAYQEEKLYLLQCRPISTMRNC